MDKTDARIRNLEQTEETRPNSSLFKFVIRSQSVVFDVRIRALLGSLRIILEILCSVQLKEVLTIDLWFRATLVGI